MAQTAKFSTQAKYLAWGLWSAALVATAIKIIHSPDRSVYDLYYLAGECIARQISLYHGACRDFRYWLGAAALFVPFAKIPYLYGALLWTVVNFGGFLYGAKKFADTFLPREKAHWFFIALLPLAWEGFFNQQINPLLAGLMMFGAAAVAREKFWRGDSALALAGLVKISPLAFSLLIGAIFPKSLWRALAAIIIANVALLALVSPDYLYAAWRDWLSFIAAENGSRHMYRDAFSVYEFFRDGAVRDSVRVDLGNYQIWQLGAAGLAFLAALKIRYYDGRKNLAAVPGVFSLAAWWLLLFGPSTEIATIALIAGGAAFSLCTAKRGFYLMLIAYILLALGASGDLEYFLTHNLSNFPASKLLLPAGGILWGVYLFANVIFFRRQPPSATPAAARNP